ncbi:YadA-like family protein [Cupriavidus sp. H19C3]|uniref:YadA-like family protein n=1 Tax=Cupriavidus sp. H19C3 TaxID=3241603 RepID=UPI003BF7B5A8
MAAAKADDQAVNLKQFKDAGLNVDPTTGTVTTSVVTYDDAKKDKVTFNKGADKSVTLANVAAAKADDQAVNLKQLKDAGLDVDPTTGGVTNSFVAYDDSTKSKVTLNKGGSATTLANVASAKADDQAVNLKQLKDAGLNIDPTTGGATNSFVAYDDSTKGKVTLNKGGNATTLSNLAAGKASDEAVNVKQLTDAGLVIDSTTGAATNSFVAYDDSTKGKVTLNKDGKATTLANVAAGKASDEAVNVKQLTDAGLVIDSTTGAATNSFVAYDDSTKGKVTLNKGGNATTLSNVAAGKASDEAVNVKQLTDAGLVIDSTTGAAMNSFVAYDDSTKGKVTLNKGGNATTLSNVAAGKASDEAVNVKQLTDAGLVIDSTTGAATNSFVAYDDSTKGKVTLNKGGKATTLANVAAGKASDEAVNVKQLTDAGLVIDSTTGAATNSFVAYDDSTKGKVTLNKGGKATTLANVAAAKADDQAVNLKQFKDAGLNVDPTTGTVTTSVVTYDDAKKDKVTFNKGADKPVTLANVAAAKADDQAVNLKQLKDAGLDVDPTTGDVTNSFVAYDDSTKGKVTLNKGGSATTLANVASAKADDQAVNLKQLKDAGLNIDPTTGGATNSFVAYDDSTKGKVTLNKGGNATTLSNLAAGKASDEAVNVKQLTDAGLVIDSTTGAATNSFVAYDDSTKGKVTLNKGGKATTLANVAAGKASDEAVNVKQLTDAGLVIDSTTGAATNSFVAYDDSTKGKVTLNKGGNATTLSNVAAGKASDEAVNVKQLTDAGLVIDSTTGAATNSFVAYDDSTKGKVTLNKDGKATTLANVAAGKASDEAVNVKQLTDAGLVIDSTTGAATNSFVAYDDSTKGKVTLNKGGSATTLANVASAKADDQAVNLKQLKDAGLNVDPTTGAATNSFVAYDDGTKGKVTLNKGGNATTLSNVAAGKASDEAVNVKQLQEAGLIIDPTTGDVTHGFVAYDDSTKEKVTFNRGGSATVLANVASAKADDQAVNLKQLKDAGLTVDPATGIATNSFVAYDDSTKARVTLNKGGMATTLSNVSMGMAETDAVNVKQLNQSVETVAVALGGGAGTDGKGGMTLPSYTINDAAGKPHEYHTVGSALSALTTSMQAIAPHLKYIKFGVSNAAQAQAAGTDSLAIGGNAFATGERALAMGRNARASGADTLALGVDSSASQINTVAIGANATVTSRDSVAIGLNSVANQANTFSVGSAANLRRVVNVAEATEGTDAVNLAQVNQLLAKSRVSSEPRLLRSSVYAATKSSLPPDELIASGPTNKGGQLEAIGVDAIAVGLNNHADGLGSVAIGSSVMNAADNAVGVGSNVMINGVNSVAIGSNVSTGADSAVAIGVQAVADADGAILIGNRSKVRRDAIDSVAIGNDITSATGRNNIVLGAGSDGSQDNVLSIGATGQERRIVNVAAGQGNTDAVNVSQLAGVANALGGGAKVNADGSIAAPKYTVGANTYSDVGNAVAALNANNEGYVSYDGSAKGAVTFNKGGDGTLLSNVAAGVSDRDAVNVKQMNDAIKAAASGAGNPLGVTYDSADKSTLTLSGQGGTRISNVAAGVNDSDAVNVKQLKDVGLITAAGETLAVTYEDASRTAVNFGGTTSVALNNVADGQVAAGSRQAVNGGQLFSLTQRVDGIDKEIARYISGGGSGGGSPFFAAAGDAAADKAVASGERSTAAGAGASATGTKATATGAGAVASANGATAIGAGASATADNAVAIGAGAVADRANAVSFGSVGQERMLTNVASVDPTDAANATSAINAATMNSAITQSAAQTLQSANQYTDRAISQMADRVNDVDRSAVRGIAAASALNNVTPYLPGRTSMNAGIAVYRGAPAIGVTVSRWNQKGNINLNGGVSSAGGNSTIVRVGAGFVF